MNVFIFTLGTRGDVQPYVALGKGLKAAGHRVVICTDTRFRSSITEHDLEAAAFNGLFTELTNSSTGRTIMEDSGSMWQLLRDLPRLLRLSEHLQRAVMDDGWKAAQVSQPDLVVYHPKAFGGPHFAEKLKVPAVMALPLPMFAPTGEFPVVGFPRLPLGRLYNRGTYRILNRLTRMITGKHVAHWRGAHGLPSLHRGQDNSHGSDGRPVSILHGYSRHVGPVPADWPPQAEATGFWFLDQPARWQPSPALVSFLSSGEPPVYVGFGSMSGNRARERAHLVMAALQRAGMRGVMASGWGGLSPDRCPPSVHVLEDVPHDWLFPRVAAVVHHGGAGTTAAGLRAGRPTVTCPFMADQPFWGRCVWERGFGPKPIPQRKLTAENLAIAIRRAVSDVEMRRRTEIVGNVLMTECGVSRAVRRLEEIQGTAVRNNG